MKKNRGFSLLEVLVTLLVVSFGLLGISALIANSLKFNQSAYARTQATWLANEIIDRMRANRVTAEVSVSPYAIAIDAAKPTGASIPEVDLNQWLTAVNDNLPGGKGSVAYNAGSGKVTVSVEWDDSSRLSGSSAVTGSGKVEVETRL